MPSEFEEIMTVFGDDDDSFFDVITGEVVEADWNVPSYVYIGAEDWEEAYQKRMRYRDLPESVQLAVSNQYRHLAHRSGRRDWGLAGAWHDVKHAKALNYLLSVEFNKLTYIGTAVGDDGRRYFFLFFDGPKSAVRPPTGYITPATTPVAPTTTVSTAPHRPPMMVARPGVGPRLATVSPGRPGTALRVGPQTVAPPAASRPTMTTGPAMTTGPGPTIRR